MISHCGCITHAIFGILRLNGPFRLDVMYAIPKKSHPTMVNNYDVQLIQKNSFPLIYFLKASYIKIRTAGWHYEKSNFPNLKILHILQCVYGQTRKSFYKNLNIVAGFCQTCLLIHCTKLGRSIFFLSYILCCMLWKVLFI